MPQDPSDLCGGRKENMMKNKGQYVYLSIAAVLFAVCILITSCAGKPADTAAGTTDNTTAAESDTVTDTEDVTEEETTVEEAPKIPGTVELYQLAPENTSLMMSYVIITPSRKVVVIDGGIDGTGLDGRTYLPAAIRAILGLKDSDSLEIEAWFLSHVHRDHYNELAKLLKNYTAEDNYTINNFYFDFPEIGVEWDSKAGAGDYDIPRLDDLKNGMDNYYSVNAFKGIKGADIPEEKYEKPDNAEHYYYDLINGAVINEETIENGLTIDIDGVSFRILLTWCQDSKYVNSTSVIMRMEYDGHSVLFLGDCASDESDRLLAKYDPSVMKSDYVQMGHHGQGGPDKKFYDAINTTDSIRLWPTPNWVWNNAQTYKIGETRSWVGLPYEAADFKSQGLIDTGRDFVAGLYKKYPKGRIDRAKNWTEEVLNGQRIAVFTENVTD